MEHCTFVCTDDDSLCTMESCSNGGECIQEWNTFTCDCDLTSFTGPTCDDGIPKCFLNVEQFGNNLSIGGGATKIMSIRFLNWSYIKF